MSIQDILTEFEGEKPFLYDDATGRTIGPGYTVQGNPTIGVGRALNKDPLSHEECQYLLTGTINRLTSDLMQYAWFASLDEVRQEAVVSMVFNLGESGFLLHWPKLIAALSVHDWVAASQECDDPHWRAQVGARADKTAKAILTGVWL